MTRDVTLEHVTVRFGAFTAVHDADLKIPGGAFFSFLGPSGCGKTTLLRCITGFQEPSEGRILIGGEDMRGIGPNKRPTALIFQNLALFPLMTVAENIAFPLEVRGIDKAARRKRADELLALVALEGQADKLPAELSGGQRQRVAIARALAVEPAILLLDEPLSALDLKLRQHMRTELRAIQRRVGLTFIYITHDQGEALTMSDRVAVMSNGRIEQVGTPGEIYDHPRSAFVASFVGENNVLPGRVAGFEHETILVDTEAGRITGREPGKSRLTRGDEAMVFVRPEAIRFGDPGEHAPNRIRVEVTGVEFEGNLRHLLLRAGKRRMRAAEIHDPAAREAKAGASLTAHFQPLAASVLPAGPLAKD